MLPIGIIFIVMFAIAVLAILIKICTDNCEPNDSRTRTNYQWDDDDYEQNNTFTTGNDYFTNDDYNTNNDYFMNDNYSTNNEIYATREVEIPIVELPAGVTYTLSHQTESTETPAAGGLASDIGSAFTDMFSSGGGFDSGGGDTGGSSYD